jgi:hypothetical protein
MEGIEADDVFTFLSEHDTTGCHLPSASVPAEHSKVCAGKKCTAKDGQSWSPGFIPKDGGTRGTNNVVGLDFLVYDLDHITPAELEHVATAFNEMSVLVHSSHSHSYPDNICIRVVLELSRTVLPKEHLALWHAGIRKYKLPMDLGKVKRGVDKKCKDPSHFYYVPRAPRGAEAFNDTTHGTPLDVDELLAEAFVYKAPPAAPPAPLDPGAVDMKGLKGKLARYRGGSNDSQVEREEKTELIRRVYAEESLAEPGDRQSSVFRAARILPWILPLGTHTEAALELLRPSVLKIPLFPDDDPAKDSVEAWMERARTAYEGGMADRYAKDAENRDGLSHAAILARKNSGGTSSGNGSSGGLPPPPGSSGAPPPPDDGGDPSASVEEAPWQTFAEYTTNKAGELVIAQIGANVREVLQRHPAWRGCLRFNDVTKDIECFGGPLAEKDQHPSVIDTAIGNWLQVAQGVKLVVNPSVVQNQILLVAMQNRYDPIFEYLNALVWDGIHRIDRWLITHCGARTISGSGDDITEYVEAISAKWLIGGATRGLKPGEQVDNVLVFEGKQGAGKSRTLRALGGEWFTDTALHLDGRDARQTAGMVWIAELAELSALRQSETDQQKAFLSAVDDLIRLPYGKRPMKFPRRCVFGGSTNDETYLRDLTGNRRYWPVHCDKFDVERTKDDRDQLWAEAVYRFRAGEKWYFEDDRDHEMVEHETNQRLHGASDADAILDWWCAKALESRPERFQLRDVAQNALGLAAWGIKSEEGNIGRALKRLGFKAVKHRVDGIPRNYYAPSELLKALPHRPVKGSRERHLSLVASAPAPRPSAPTPGAKS